MNNFSNNNEERGFGLTNFLLRKNIASNRAAAEAMSKKILIGIIVVCLGVTALNFMGGDKEEIPEKYYYDPLADTEEDI